ncbi:alpha-2-macroglobulin family protein [Lewinella sp. IMCC34191]|uniref:alpha-2-macroglobulin family protein n=1 Tax=Lewinella sp. IMCC34191 TaxID=2259172 RepID=UPI000E24141F|nr:alpha-2-macroglobulin family protein [Lewinella sp. IMCC34191]
MRPLFILLLALLAGTLMAQYDDAYANIESLSKQGNYRSALTAAEDLFTQALADDRQDHMARSLAYRALFVQSLEEDGQQATVVLLREATAAHPDLEVYTALAHLLLGETYHQYAEQNSYRLSQLTTAGEEGVPDTLALADYGLDQLLYLSQRHIYRALELTSENRTPLVEIPGLIEGGDGRTDELPTLYDLIVDRAMNVLGSGLGSVTDDRTVDPASLLVPAEAFAAIDLGLSYDLRKGTPRKLSLYQQWITYHLDAGGPALLYADLQRMHFVRVLGAADSSYLSALERMYDSYVGVDTRDRILVEMAEVLDRDDESLGERPRVRALELLDRVGEEAVARARAGQLRASIRQRSLTAETYSFYPLKEHLLVSLGYRNVDRAYYRVYAMDPADGQQPRYRTDRLLEELAGMEEVARGNQGLQTNDDFGTHRTELDLDPLPAGGYRLVVANSEDLSAEETTFTVVDFQVSNIAAQRINGEEGTYMQVTDGLSGAPLTDVAITVLREGRRGQYREIGTRRTDDRGTFELPAGDRYVNYRLVLTRRQNNDRLVIDQYQYDRTEGDRNATDYTTLLTDRPIYRPGQTVHVYGLRFRRDRDEMPAILPNDQVTVTLRDANYQEVTSRDVTSDAFGRFSLDFELPEGGLTGGFTIQTDNGSASFQVEEYKRPRFEVSLDGPDSAPAGEIVTVGGTALTYAGPPVAEGQVSYRVYLEEVRWAFYYFRGGGGNERELLTSGTTETGEAGTFDVTFTVPPSLRAPGYRRYRFVVEADVTDPTGETHEATTSVALRGERPAVAVTPERETVDRGDSLTLNVLSDGEGNVRIDVRVIPVIKPNAALLDRPWAMPDRPVINPSAFERNFPYLAYAPVPELAEWPADGDAIFEESLTVSGETNYLRLAATFAVGHYRIEWNYPDGTAGQPATFSVYDAGEAELPAGVLYQLDRLNDTVRVGEKLTFRLISAVELPLVLSQWQSRRGIDLRRDESDGSLTLSYTPTEEDRGGLMFELAFVRLNRSFTERRQLELPWDDKKLEVTYATFRDRLRPGEPEQWTIELRTPDGEPAAAAALATMYDASLDQLYAGQDWTFSPYPTFYGGPSLTEGGSFGSAYGRPYGRQVDPVSDTVPSLPELLLPNSGNISRMLLGKVRGITMRASSVQRFEAVEEEAAIMDSAAAGNIPPPPPPAEPTTPQEEEPVNIRTNLQETAFWLPELTAGDDGALRISFTSPEALTAWKFRLFSHDKALRYVISEREIVTQKELMVLPNVPRFLREGDRIELTARVSNTTDGAMDATVELELFNPQTGETIPLSEFSGGGAQVENLSSQSVSLNAQGSATARFALYVPEGKALEGPVGYRIIARSASFSDGEENVIPVLSDRTLVTARVPFYLRRGDTKTVELPGLADFDSETLEQVSYTFEATTNPAWLALKALPYLMEYPYDCTEQLANRFFANQLAYATVSTKPVLEEVFRKWQSDSTALLSELERNQDLKSALLTETPWVREAQSESEQRARIADLFQLTKLAKEQKQALAKLAARQESDGSYSWFPGGPSNPYMTQYVLETFGRMRELDVIDGSQESTVQRITDAAIGYLDGEMEKQYDRLFGETKDSVKLRQEYRPTALQVHYLYARSRFAKIGALDSKALTFFRDRAFATWTGYGLYEQALVALIADAAGNDRATLILESLRERAIHSDEFGMYWKYERGVRWNNLPIETHTRILEAFRTIDPQSEEMDDMRLWLLTNKRTNAWPTTKSTAAAVFALLNAEGNFTVGKTTVPLKARWPNASRDLSDRIAALQQQAEAATGAFELRLPAEEVNRDLAKVRVSNTGNDLVWGGIYWQYTEVAEQVEESHNGPLTLERQLFLRTGDHLEPLAEDATLAPGDRVTVRLTVTSDRDMDYVHVKDRRAATFEPVDALSAYTYQNGLGYYFAPGDLATNFFISDLPKGTYTLEYDLFTTYAGSFSNGLGRVECMYAPEFGGNSAGGRIIVR